MRELRTIAENLWGAVFSRNFRTGRSLSRALCASALVLVTFGAEQVSAGDLPVIRIGYSVWVGYGPFFLAQEKGIFERNGVRVEMVKIDDTKFRYAALAAGRLDGIMTTPTTISMHSKPDYLVEIVLPLDESSGGDGIVAKHGIERVQDLMGKTVAFESGSVSEYFIYHVLTKAGMGVQDVKGLNMKPDDAAAAFYAGKVDAALTWEPWLSKARSAPDSHVLLDSTATPGVIVDALAFPKAVLAEKREAIRGVVKGWFEALEYFKTHREESIPIMSKKVGGWLEKPEDYAATLAGVRYYDHDAAVRYMGGSESPAMKITRTALDLWVGQGKADKNLRASDLLDNSLLQ